MKATTFISLTVILGLLGTTPGIAQTSGGTGGNELAERVAALKSSIQESQKRLRSYQWIETTVVSFKGEEKSRRQDSCYYGADGSLQKVPVASTPPPEKKGGLRGKIAESKKEELTGTMKQAVSLVKMYLPPDPALLQKSKDAGKASLDVLQPGKLVRLVFRDYRLPGDALSITVDLASNRLNALNVATYLGQPNSPVKLDVRLGALDDGTTYPADTQLAAQSANVSVAVKNSGYRKLN